MKQFILRVLGYLEIIINRVFIYLRVKLLKTSETVYNVNSPKSWEKMYMVPVKPFSMNYSEVGEAIIKFTSDGDSLLETGCGSGELSAYLALKNRKIHLCDFSDQILQRASELFKVSNISLDGKYNVDITKKFPFKDNEFDVVWSSGVLEHWTDDELVGIIDECVRVSKKSVISIIPNNSSLAYRFGRELCESNGIAPWGRELPRSTFLPLFKSAGLKNIHEEVLSVNMANHFIHLLNPSFGKQLSNWMNTLPADDDVLKNQGYLLLTVGYK